MEENKVLDEVVSEEKQNTEELTLKNENVGLNTSKKKKLLVIAMAITCVCLIVAIVMLTNMIIAKKNYEKFAALCDGEQYSEALALWEEKIKDNEESEVLVEEIAEKAITEYKNGSMEFSKLEEVIEFYSEICEEGELLTEFNELKEIEDAFQRGVLLAEGEQYVEAANEFKKIPEGHKYYEASRYNLEYCADGYEDILEEDFLSYIFKGDYKSALSGIEAYKEMGGKSEDILEHEQIFLYMKEDYEREDLSNYYPETTAFTYSYVTGDRCVDVSETDTLIIREYNSSMYDYYDYLDYHEARGWYKTDAEDSDSSCTYGLHRGDVTVYVSYLYGRGIVWVSLDK